jgi:hypothetical protein
MRKKVEVVNYPDGRFAVQFNGTTLGFKVFDKIQTVQPGAIATQCVSSIAFQMARNAETQCQHRSLKPGDPIQHPKSKILAP